MYWSIGEGLLEYWCRVVLALLYFQDYLFSDVLTLFQQTQPYGNPEKIGTYAQNRYTAPYKITSENLFA